MRNLAKAVWLVAMLSLTAGALVTSRSDGKGEPAIGRIVSWVRGYGIFIADSKSSGLIRGAAGDTQTLSGDATTAVSAAGAGVLSGGGVPGGAGVPAGADISGGAVFSASGNSQSAASRAAGAGGIFPPAPSAAAGASRGAEMLRDASLEMAGRATAVDRTRYVVYGVSDRSRLMGRAVGRVRNVAGRGTAVRDQKAARSSGSSEYLAMRDRAGAILSDSRQVVDGLDGAQPILAGKLESSRAGLSAARSGVNYADGSGSMSFVRSPRGPASAQASALKRKSKNKKQGSLSLAAE